MKRTLMAMILALAAAGAVSAADKETLFKWGGSLDYFSLWTSQNAGQEIGHTFGYWGVSAFFDVTDYFTASASFLRGMGYLRGYFEGTLSTEEPSQNNINEALLGAAVKYPFSFDTFVVSPKLGIASAIFLGGGADDNPIEDADTRQYVSPFSIIC